MQTDSSKPATERLLPPAPLLGGIIRSIGNRQQLCPSEAQSCLQILDSRDCERLQLPAEYAGKYIQKLDFRGYGFGTYRIHNARPNMSSKKTPLFYRLVHRVSIWIRSMRVSYRGVAVSPNDKAEPREKGPQ